MTVQVCVVQVERLEGVQCEANKAEMMGGRLRTRVEELEAQLGVMGEAQAKALQVGDCLVVVPLHPGHPLLSLLCVCFFF